MSPRGRVRLQFVCAADIMSRAIAWYGNGYGGFSHVDAVLPSGELLGARSDHITSMPDGSPCDLRPGVRVRPPGYERTIRRAVVEVPCTPRQADEWEAWLRGQIGKPYDKDAIAGFLLGRPWHQKGHWICSACQTGALAAAGLVDSPPVPDSRVTPDTLYVLSVSGARGRVTVSEGMG